MGVKLAKLGFLDPRMFDLEYNRLHEQLFLGGQISATNKKTLSFSFSPIA
jgi:hypothetical protein